MKNPGNRSIGRAAVVACASLTLAACVHNPDYVKPTATTAGVQRAPAVAAPAAAAPPSPSQAEPAPQ